MRKIAFWLLLAGLVARDVSAQVAQPASATPLTYLSLEELGNVEVTTLSKGPETLLQSPAAVYVITQEDIRRSGATSLPDVLRLAPGLNVGRIDSGHWSVGVRGFGDQFSKSLLVLVDGRSVYTPLFAGIYWAVEDTVLADIDRIEVIRGPGGSIWGANAVNGVINIITKSSTETEGTLVSAGGGTVDQGLMSFRYGGHRGAGLTYRVYGKGFRRGPELHSDGQDYDDWHMGQSGFRADWAQPAGSLTIQGDVYKGATGQNVVTGSLSPLSDVMSYDPVNLSGGNLLARWQHKLPRTGQIQLQGFYDRTFLLGPQIGETRNTFDVDFVHRLPKFLKQDLQWGLGARVSPSRVTQTVDGLDVLPHDQTAAIYSGFVEDQLALAADRLSLTLGAKLEHNNYTGAEAQPSARLLWKATQRQSAWAAVTQSVRTPSRLEEGLALLRFLGGTPPTFLEVVGNHDFRSEKLLGYEAGYRSAIDERLFVDVAAFRNRHDDLESFGTGTVQVVTSPPPARVLLVVPYANSIAGTSSGAELTADWKPAHWWQMKGSYSYLHLDLSNSLPADPFKIVGMYEGSSPRHRIVLRPLVTLPRGFEIDSTYRHESGLSARAASAYSSLDVRVGWRAGPAVNLSLVGQNLLEGHHLEFAHDPGPSVAVKRSVYAAVTWGR